MILGHEGYSYPKGEPGAGVLRNLKGITSHEELNKEEAFYSLERRATLADAVGDFRPSLDSLKDIHKHLFQDIYEWAGVTRAETARIDGQDVRYPPDFVMTKPNVEFGETRMITDYLPGELDKSRATLDAAYASGALEKAAWADETAKQVGLINEAHPFREGNGRTMRAYIELSAERYGFQVKTSEFAINEWMQTSNEARWEKKHQPLARLIDRFAVTADLAQETPGALILKDVESIRDPARQEAARSIISKISERYVDRQARPEEKQDPDLER